MDAAAAYQLVTLANGAHSIYSLAHDETFHPVIGPVAEAEALYVHQLRLADRLSHHAGEFVVWDVGLGAAANAVTVLRAAAEIPGVIRIVSFDQTLDPLRFALRHTDQLGYLHRYQQPLQQLATGASAIQFHDGSRTVCWELQLGDFPTLLNGAEAERLPKPDAILYDAFSPAANPAMWTQPLFARVFRLLSPNRPCALPTYSRSTMLRVSLLLAGFFVGRGHATGEKEETTIAANALDLLEEPLDFNWLRRARNSTSAEPLWTGVYRQAPLSASTWAKLQLHPQFKDASDQRLKIIAT